MTHDAIISNQKAIVNYESTLNFFLLDVGSSELY